MSVITITSDWGLGDHYLGSIKGKIINLVKHVTIVDINHQIQPFNIAQAAFIVRNSYKNFPEGTIHLICVNSESSEDKPHLAIKTNGHYFITADNGLPGLIFKEKPEEVVRLKEQNRTTFPELTIFIDAAVHIANNESLTGLGESTDQFTSSVSFRPVVDYSVITGSVIYIDSYRNAITNIAIDLFNEVGKNRPFEILIRSNHYKISKINSRYGDTPVGELLAIFNSLNLLEIAINKGNIAELLSLEQGSTVRVKFFDKKTTK